MRVTHYIHPIRAWADSASVTTLTCDGGFRHQRRISVDPILRTSGVGCHQPRGLYEAQSSLLVEFPLLGLLPLPGGHATPAIAVLGDGRRLRRGGSTRRAVSSRREKKVGGAVYAGHHRGVGVKASTIYIAGVEALAGTFPHLLPLGGSTFGERRHLDRLSAGGAGNAVGRDLRVVYVVWVEG